jgi:PAS domain S-box-containing protein
VTATLALDGWQRLFTAAFRQSRNPMALTDGARRIVDVNGALLRLLGYERAALVGVPVWRFVKGGPLFDDEQWETALSGGPFDGEAEMLHADGGVMAVQWAARTEVATGRRLVLFVALSTSRSGRRLRAHAATADEASAARRLSRREQDVVRLVALGWTDREIADELHIAHYTVRTHVRNAMRKTGARSRAHLVARSLADGLALA